MTDRSPFSAAFSMLLSENCNVSELVALSDFGDLSFFRGADLAGLDLSGQDLRGFDFEGADLRGTNLDGVAFDEGAFNLAHLDQKYESIKDPFTLYLDEITADGNNKVGGYGAFRPGFIDNWKTDLRYNLYEIADACQISASTLRKARAGHFVLMSTVRLICAGLQVLMQKTGKVPSFACGTVVRFQGASFLHKLGDDRQQFITLGSVARSYIRVLKRVRGGEPSELNYYSYSTYFLSFLYDQWVASGRVDFEDFAEEFYLSNQRSWVEEMDLAEEASSELSFQPGAA